MLKHTLASIGERFPYVYNDEVKKTKKNQSKKKRYLYLKFVPLVGCLILFIPGFTIYNSLTHKPNEPTHGQRIQETPSNDDLITVKPVPQVEAATSAETSSKPGYGIAAGNRLMYLGQTDLNNYFAKLKTLGVTWVRWDIDWSAVQAKSSTEYNWQGADRVAATSQAYGIKSLGIITYTPKWARLASCDSSDKCEPASATTFGKFAGEVALRYKNKIDYYEIWNEPNYRDFWLPAPSVSNYRNVLTAAYTQIKASNSKSFVISGGLASIGNENGSISPLTFIDQLYALKTNKYLDAIGLHPYSYPALPTYNADWNRWQQIVPIYAIMSANGDSTKKIWVTEYGAPTDGLGVGHTTLQLDNFEYNRDYMTDEAQNDVLISALTSYKSYSAWTGPFFWYSLQDNGTSKNTTENFFGLLRYDNSMKPAYSTYQNVIKSTD